MKETRTLGLAALVVALVCFGAGCDTVDPSSPYYGQEFRQGLPAMGTVLAPYASPDAPINRDPAGSLQRLQGMGTLIDLLGH